MARLPRIDLAGFHHVVNRGVERRNVFLDREDHEEFLDLLCVVCEQFDVTVHSYCLMSNHYHLLIETQQENLSKVMRAINAQYAAYFNRKQKRVGHLWQGRFKSWFVTDEAYLYTLIKYIEFNPIKAKMVERIGDYTYSSYLSFVGKEKVISCLGESVMFTQFLKIEDRVEFFESWYDEGVLLEIQKSSRLVVSSMGNKTLSLETLKMEFPNCDTKLERNIKILEAVEAGYSQHMIAKAVGVSQGAISNVVKRSRVKN